MRKIQLALVMTPFSPIIVVALAQQVRQTQAVNAWPAL
jgi:hypothetical protein